MSVLIRMWLAFAAIGVGLIHLALVISSPLPLGVAFAALGAAEFAWGVTGFARDRVPLPRLALTVALAPVLAWGVAMLVGLGGEAPLLPLAVTSLLELGVAAVLGFRLRRGAESAVPPPAGRFLLGVCTGAVVVGALVTPALAATEAGANAVPHGELSVPGDVHH